MRKIKSFLAKTTLLMGVGILYSANALADTCTISRSGAPINWNHNEYTSQVKTSSFSPEACNVQPGSTITNIRASFTATVNRKHLTNGLVPGHHVLRVSGSGNSGEVILNVTQQGHTTSGTNGNISAFNGLDLNGLNFTVQGLFRNGTALRCRNNNNPSDCNNFKYMSYGLVIDYEPASVIPDKPSPVTATISNGNDITIAWGAPSNSHYYVREVSINSGAYQNTKTYYHPQTSVVFQDQQARTYRYRVKACNSGGDCSPWEYSNSVTVTIIPTAPSSVTASVSNGDDVTISWSGVSGAVYYNREVSINGGAYQNRKKYFAPQTSVVFRDQQSRTYQYRVRACNSSDQCSAWTNSNQITVN